MGFSTARPTCTDATLAAKFGNLAFEDHFNGTDPNPAIWDAGYYNPDRAVKNYDCHTYVDGGSVTRSVLRIWPQRDASLDQGQNTITPNGFFRRDITTGNRGFRQTYGFIEASMKLCTGAGTWPAFWAFAPDGSAQELDVMEAWIGGSAGTNGWGPDNYAATVWNNSSAGSKLGSIKLSDTLGGRDSTLTTAFHTYGMAWTPDTIYFLFDGDVVASFANGGITHAMLLYFDLWFPNGLDGTGSESGWPTVAATPQGSTNAFEIDYVRSWLYLGAGGATGPAANDGGGSVTPPATEYKPAGNVPALGTLTFDEDFAAFDPAKWVENIYYESASNTANYDVSGGKLRLFPTSGFENRTITTDGKFAQRYGYFEATIKLLRGKGAWPRFFLHQHIDDLTGTQTSARPQLDILQAFPGGSADTPASTGTDLTAQFHTGLHSHRSWGGGSSNPSFDFGVFRDWDRDGIHDMTIWNSDDTIDFTDVDATYAAAAASGAKILKNFGSVPTWAAKVQTVSDVSNFSLKGSSRYGVVGSMSGPADLDLYESYVTRFVQHTQSYLWAVEGWNEPFDNDADAPYEFFTGSTTELADIQQRLYRATKSVNRDILVFSPPNAWINGVQLILDARCSDGTPMHNYFDVLAWHPYTYTADGAGGTLRLEDAVNTIRGYMTARGISKPLADTEHGFFRTIHPGGEYVYGLTATQKGQLLYDLFSEAKRLGLLTVCLYSYDDGLVEGNFSFESGTPCALRMQDSYDDLDTQNTTAATVTTPSGVQPWQDGTFHPIDYKFDAVKANADYSYFVTALDKRMSDTLPTVRLDNTTNRFGVYVTRDIIQFYLNGNKIGPQLTNDYWHWPLFLNFGLWYGSLSGTPNTTDTPLGTTNAYEIERVSAWALLDGSTSVVTALPPPAMYTGGNTYAAGDTFAVKYANGTINYLYNGLTVRSVPNLPTDLTFFFDSAFYSVGSSLQNISFGGGTGLIDWSQIRDGGGKPADNATVGATIGVNLQGQMVDAPGAQNDAGNFIAKGAIVNDLIADVIESPDFIPGPNGRGWRIDKQGNVEFQNGFFRGVLGAGIVLNNTIDDYAVSNIIYYLRSAGNGTQTFTIDMDHPGDLTVLLVMNLSISGDPSTGSLSASIAIDAGSTNSYSASGYTSVAGSFSIMTGASLIAGTHTVTATCSHNLVSGNHSWYLMVIRRYK